MHFPATDMARGLRIARGRKAGSAISWPPLPIVLVILSFICPTELSINLGELRFPPHRFAFIVFLPFALARLVSHSDTRIHAFDIVFLAFATWQVGIYTYHSATEGFVYGGSLALEILGAYFIPRAYIRDVETLLATLKALLASIAAVAVLGLLDTLTGSYVTHNLLRPLTGGAPMPPIEFRKGIPRAASTFDHPIHFGCYAASMLALVWMAERERLKRYAKAALVAFATLLAMSSAPLLSIGLQSGMLVWEHWTRGFAIRVHLTLAIIAGLYIGIAFIADRPPIQLLVTGMTFDPWTGLYRMLIWEHGLTNVWASPWTGLGLAEWDRPAWMVSSTIDAYWLVLPMRSGIPAFILLVLAIILLGRAVVKRSTRSKDALRRRLARGWFISLVAMCLLGATVHFWNVPHAMFFFFLGLGGVLADPRRAKRKWARHIAGRNIEDYATTPSAAPMPA